jgi:hypothetical protein
LSICLDRRLKTTTASCFIDPLNFALSSFAMGMAGVVASFPGGAEDPEEAFVTNPTLSERP